MFRIQYSGQTADLDSHLAAQSPSRRLGNGRLLRPVDALLGNGGTTPIWLLPRSSPTAGGFGRYRFRLTWDAAASGPAQGRSDLDRPRGPEGFAWNNAVNFRGRGTGESRRNDYGQRLGDVSVDIDRGGKIVVSFMPERGRGSDRERRPVLFTGTVAGPRLRADMVTEDRRLHGAMTLSVDDRQNVNSIAMEATDGRDRLHLTWDRR